MYTAQVVKERIKDVCKIKKISIKKMLQDCSLSINTVIQISDNKGISAFSLAKIADYLNVSVDYLLGRTDDPIPFINNSQEILSLIQELDKKMKPINNDITTMQVQINFTDRNARKEERIKFVNNMNKKGLSIEDIAEISKLTEKQVINIINNDDDNFICNIS